jgi:hypothetical protein
MATDIRIKELNGVSGGLDTSASSHRLKYDVWDANKEANVLQMRAALIAALPPVIDTNCGLDSLSWEEDEKKDHYVFTAGYTSKQLESTVKISWDSTGGTVRMSTSRATTRYARSGVTAPNFRNAINVRNNEVEGVDVVTPALKLTFTYRWPKGVMNLAYIKAAAGMVGTTNDATFWTFGAGELLFLGTTGELDPTVATDVQYHFAASSNATGLSIGDIASVAKGGHQYLWVMFDQATDADRLVQRPRACYVETVYGASNFNSFGIGS